MKHSGFRKAIGAFGALTLVVGGVSLDIAPASAVAPFPISDTGKGTPGAVDTTWAYSRGGTNNTTGNTYTTDGWVRLTNATNTQSTNILDDRSFPSSTGFRVTFDYRQAGGTPHKGAQGENSGTGDGLAMYLIDAKYSITSGAPGSALGYAAGGTGQSATATQCVTGGVQGGYLGLGLDVFGNYASPNFGSGGGQNLGSSEIGLRGSGSGCTPSNYNSRYPWVTGKVVPNLWTGTSGSTADPATVANSMYRRVTITVVPQGNNVQVTVAMSALTAKNSPAGAMTQVFTANLNGVAGQVPLPANLKLGFSASTGAATDYHDIRNIAVSALTDPSITKTLSTSTPGHEGYPAGTFLPGDPISFTLTATNNGPSVIGDTPDGVARVYDDLSKLPISKVSWTCDPSGGAACANGSGGTSSIVSQDWTGPSGSSVTVTVSGTVTATPGTFTNTAILPTDFTKNVVDPDNPYAQKDMGAVDTDTTNNTATAQFAVVVPHFTQTKSADKTQYQVGDPVTYTVTVTNDGKGEGDASLIDAVPTNVDVTGATCAPDSNATCTVATDGNKVSGTVSAKAGGTAVYTITGTVTDGPSATNVATVTPDVPGCAPADCGGGEITTPGLPVVAPSLSLKKTAMIGTQPAVELAVGDNITYEFVIKNIGDTEQDDVGITEGEFTGNGELTPSCPATAAGWPSGKLNVLAASQTVTCTASYTVTQDDMDNGHLSNTATAYGTPPGFDTPTKSDPSTSDVKATGGPAITVTKRADISSLSVPVKAGDPVVYTVTATNTGSQTLTGFQFTDAMKGLPPLALAWDGDPDTLLPGQTVTGTATHILTQADLNSGTVSNTATVTAHDPQGGPVSDDDSALVDLTKTPGYGPGLSMTKTDDISAFSSPVKAGDPITYTVTATNSGDVTLTSVALADALPGISSLALSWPPDTTPGTLQPGQKVTGTATYTLTQKDLDAGIVSNTATSTAKDPKGNTVTGTVTKDTDLTATDGYGPYLSVVKTDDFSAIKKPAHVGSTINYKVTATNAGDVTLSGLSFTDSLPGVTVACPTAATDWMSKTVGVLAPGDTITCAASYGLTQADIEAASVTNTATGAAKDPKGNPVGGDGKVVSNLTPYLGPFFTQSKVADQESYVPGQAITYTITVNNTGSAAGTTGITDTVPDTVAVTGASCVATPTDMGTCDVSFDGNNITGSTSLPVGGTAVVTVTGKVLGGPEVTNTAVVTPRSPICGEDDADCGGGLAPTGTIPVLNPSLTVDKTVTADGETPATLAVGQQLDYTFVVTNTGETPLRDVKVVEGTFTGSGTLSPVTCPADAADWPSGEAGVLDLDQAVTCTASYTVTQTDADAGSVTNSATAQGTPPGVDDPVDSPSDTADVSSDGKATLAVTKMADLSEVHPQAEVGDPVGYTITAKNTGPVTLHDVVLTDDLEGLTVQSYLWPDNSTGDTGSLGPNETVTVKATYPLTQADFDAGKVTNTAIGTAKDPKGGDVTDTTTIDTDLSGHLASKFDWTKTANGTSFVPGQSIIYTLSAGNTGNIAGLASFTDPVPDTVTVSSVSCAAIPLDSGTCTVSHVGNLVTGTVNLPASGTAVITINGTINADAPAGSMATNQATVTGPCDKKCDPITDPITVLTPGLTVVKTADITDMPTPVRVGDTVMYTIDVTNTGQADLTDVKVSDSLIGAAGLAYLWPDGTVGNTGSLAVGQDVVVTASYALTQADLDAGTVTNTATGSGTDQAGNTVTGKDTITTDITSHMPALTLEKTGTVDGPSQDVLMAGETVNYQFTVKNTGRTPLHDVGVSEGKFSGTNQMSAVTCPADAAGWASGTVGLLNVGDTVNCSASYVLSQDDVDWGLVINTATAHGTPPDSDIPTVSPPASAQVPSNPDPSVTVVKTADLSGVQTPAQVGDKIAYTVVVTNIGAVTLSNVSVTDDLAGLTDVTYAWPDGTTGTTGKLAPNAAVTVTANYPLTQADLDAGKVTNTAVGTGTPPSTLQDPDPQPIPPTSDTIVTDITDHLGPDFDFVKTGKLADGAAGVAGDTINYHFTATNTGDVTLNDVTIADKLAGLSDITYNWPGQAGTLAPGQKLTATATYKLTQADVDAGGVHNQAVVTGTPPYCTDDATCNPPKGDDSTDVPVAPHPGLTTAKTANVSKYSAGTVITYTFTVTNTGNVTLTGVKPVEGAFTGSGSLSGITCPASTLAPGQAMNCTATYTATQADVNAGKLANSATAVGNPPDNSGGKTPPGLTTSAPSTVTLTAVPILVQTGGVMAGGMAWQLGVFGVGLMLGVALAAIAVVRRSTPSSCA